MPDLSDEEVPRGWGADGLTGEARSADPSADDPVLRNRATPRRSSPGRAELGARTTRVVLAVTLVVVLAATVVLVAVALGGR